jgi:hypothetical protein
MYIFDSSNKKMKNFNSNESFNCHYNIYIFILLIENYITKEKANIY